MELQTFCCRGGTPAYTAPVSVTQEWQLLTFEWEKTRQLRYALPYIQTGIRLLGKIDCLALAKSLNELTCRHELLRASFSRRADIVERDEEERIALFGMGHIFLQGGYQQIIHSDTICHQEIISCNLTEPKDISKAILQNIRMLNPYELPRLAAGLATIEDGEHIIVIVVDHMVSDSWSIDILRCELVELYRYFVGQISILPPRPRKAFVDLPSQHVEKVNIEPASTYWRDQWEEFGAVRISPRDLPFYRGKWPDRSYIQRSDSIILEEVAMNEIRRTARRARVTIYMFCLAALALLLRTYSQRSRFALWTHFANRTTPEAENIVGCFVNSHIIGLDFGGLRVVLDLLMYIRRVVADGQKNQAISLGVIWNSLCGCNRRSDDGILLDFRSCIEERAPKSWAAVGICDYPLSPVSGRRFASLGIYLVERRSEMSISAYYNHSQFSAAAIHQVLEDFKTQLVLMSTNERAMLV